MRYIKPLFLLAFIFVFVTRPVVAIWGYFEDTQEEKISDSLTDTSTLQLTDSQESVQEKRTTFSFQSQEAFDAEKSALAADAALFEAADKAQFAVDKAEADLKAADDIVSDNETSYNSKSEQVDNLKVLLDKITKDTDKLSQDIKNIMASLDIKEGDDSYGVMQFDDVTSSLQSSLDSSGMAKTQIENIYNDAVQDLESAKKQLSLSKLDQAKKKVELSYLKEVAKIVQTRADEAKLQAVKRSEQLEKLSTTDFDSMINDSTVKPMAVSSEPLKQAPVEASPNATPVKQVPVKAAPEMVSDKQESVKATPAPVKPAPAKAVVKPAPVKPAPAKAAVKPATVKQAPAKAAVKPVPVKPAQAKAAVKPAPVKQAPAKLELTEETPDAKVKITDEDEVEVDKKVIEEEVDEAVKEIEKLKDLKTGE